LSHVLDAIAADDGNPRHWTDLMIDAGRDGDVALLQSCGEGLARATRSTAEGAHDRIIGDLTAILNSAKMSLEDRSVVLAARALFRIGNRQNAAGLADMTEAVNLAPEEVRFLLYRAAIWNELGEVSKAVDDIGAAIDLEPSNAELWGSRAELYRSMTRYGDALADLTKALELNPSYAWAWAVRGQTHREAGEYPEALADLTKAIELKPDDAWNWGQRGQTHQQAGEYPEALADLTKAIELDPSYAWAWGARGHTYVNLREFGDAVSDYQHAVELDPVSATYHNNLGMAYLGADRVSDAIAEFERRVQLDPYNAANAELCIGLIQHQNGNRSQANLHFERALAQLDAASSSGSLSPVALIHARAVALLGLVRHTEAYQILRDARPSDTIDDITSWLYWKMASICEWDDAQSHGIISSMHDTTH
jgi:tetratricopeptide (TPR) repeat protein